MNVMFFQFFSANCAFHYDRLILVVMEETFVRIGTIGLMSVYRHWWSFILWHILTEHGKTDKSFFKSINISNN